MADNRWGFRWGWNKLVPQLDTSQGCPAKMSFPKLLARRSGVVMGVAGTWGLVAQHTLLPQKQLGCGGPAECFSRTEVCTFSGACSPEEGSLQVRNPRCSACKQCPCNSLGSKTQPEQTQWYLWSSVILLRVNIHMYYCRCTCICRIQGAAPEPPGGVGNIQHIHFTSFL